LTYFDKYRNILDNSEVSVGKKNSSFIFWCVGFLWWKKINVLFAWWRFSIQDFNVNLDFFSLLPTVAICGGRDFKAPTYQTVTILSNCTNVQFTHITRLTYIAC
jgi:hypothetical protein